ncbi:MAG: GTPase HflX [Clostridiales bacterium]
MEDKNDLYLVAGEEEERAILVGVEILSENTPKFEMIDLDELEELAKTAGAEVVHKVYQKRDKVNPTYYAGSGTIEEIKILVDELDIDIVIFDNELSGSQTRNIEEYLDVKVLDRTMIILDIFAKRASSREGKLQVELAQLKYRMPRLTGLGKKLSRLGGGIGTRGPGEKKLESDRRHIRRRINNIELEIAKVKKRRENFIKSRERKSIFTIALVGYTNAGKSTLLNQLCDSDVFSEDKLFATLDTTSRKFNLENYNVVLVDTVGFIRRLPHDLIEAFKSTLEQVRYTDAYIHVVDSSNSDCENQILVVNRLLKELEAFYKPNIIVFNKSDINLKKDCTTKSDQNENIKTHDISAKTGVGINKLKESIKLLIREEMSDVNLLIPYGDEKILSFLNKFTNVIKIKYTEKGVELYTTISKEFMSKVEKYIFYYNEYENNPK